MEDRISDLEGRIAQIEDLGLSGYISSQRSKKHNELKTLFSEMRDRYVGMLLNDLYKKECCITKSIDVFCRENI